MKIDTIGQIISILSKLDTSARSISCSATWWKDDHISRNDFLRTTKFLNLKMKYVKQWKLNKLIEWQTSVANSKS